MNKNDQVKALCAQIHLVNESAHLLEVWGTENEYSMAMKDYLFCRKGRLQNDLLYEFGDDFIVCHDPDADIQTEDETIKVYGIRHKRLKIDACHIPENKIDLTIFEIEE